MKASTTVIPKKNNNDKKNVVEYSQSRFSYAAQLKTKMKLIIAESSVVIVLQLAVEVRDGDW